MAKREKAAKRIRTLREMDHERCDYIPPHPGFASRKAELEVERRIARDQGVTDPARVSGDVMAREKARYLDSHTKE